MATRPNRVSKMVRADSSRCLGASESGSAQTTNQRYATQEQTFDGLKVQILKDPHRGLLRLNTRAAMIHLATMDGSKGCVWVLQHHQRTLPATRYSSPSLALRRCKQGQQVPLQECLHAAGVGPCATCRLQRVAELSRTRARHDLPSGLMATGRSGCDVLYASSGEGARLGKQSKQRRSIKTKAVLAARPAARTSAMPQPQNCTTWTLDASARRGPLCDLGQNIPHPVGSTDGQSALKPLRMRHPDQELHWAIACSAQNSVEQNSENSCSRRESSEGSSGKSERFHAPKPDQNWPHCAILYSSSAPHADDQSQRLFEKSDNPDANCLREPLACSAFTSRAPRGQIGAASIDLERRVQDKAMSGDATRRRCDPNGGYRVALRAFESSYAIITKAQDR